MERIVIGIVKSVAREFYGVEVEMTLEGSKSTGLDHAIFSIKEIAYYDRSIDAPSPVHSIDSSSEKQLISSKSFCQEFPVPLNLRQRHANSPSWSIVGLGHTRLESC